MSDTEKHNAAASTTSTSTSLPKAHCVTKKEKKVRYPRAKLLHPPTSPIVNNVIKGLQELENSSLNAIKKYIASHYNVDAEKVAPFVKK